MSEPALIATVRHRVADSLIIGLSLLMMAAFAAINDDAGAPPPPDFASMPVEVKKRRFFAYLSPMVSDVNFRLAAERDQVRELRARLADGGHLGWFDRRWLGRLAVRLEVDLESQPLEDALVQLERRAGIVPESIVLMQAAVESGWGTSRFAVEGNNYFGQRCYSAGCGIIPEERPDGSRFGLAEFVSAAQSVESYMLNLNTHDSYRQFRQRRERLRSEGRPVTGLALVDGLANYSERGQEYVEQIASMIRSNGLE